MTSCETQPLRRGYEIAAFAVTVAYVPWFADAASAPRWMLLSLLVPMFVCIRAMTPAHICGGLFLGWATLSIAWTPVPIEAIQPLWHFALLAGVFCIGAEMESLEPLFVGAGWGVAVSSAVTLFQTEHTGLFLNKNFMAEAAVLVLIGLLVYQRYWLAALAFPAALLPVSRAALLALSVLGVLLIARRSRLLAGGVVLGGLVAVLLLDPNAKSLGQRLVVWSDTWQHLTWMGHGLGAFYIDLPAFRPDGYALRLDHAHNDLLELTYELGVGVGLLVLLWGAALLQPNPLRYVLIAFTVEGCFGFPLFLPVTGALAALCTGYLCSQRYRLHQSQSDGERRVRAGPRHFGLRPRGVASAAGG